MTAQKIKKKRGRKPGQQAKSWKLIYCRTCGDLIGAANASGYRRTGAQKGKPINICKACARVDQLLKLWKRKSKEEIQTRIQWHKEQMDLLSSLIKDGGNNND